MTTTQVRQGRLSQDRKKARLAIEGGTESFISSCGRKGSAPIAPTSEHYDIQLGGDKLELHSGATRWRFARGVGADYYITGVANASPA